MEKNACRILDVHTHRLPGVSGREGVIVNCRLSADSPLHTAAEDSGIPVCGEGVLVCGEGISVCGEGGYYSAGIHPWDLTGADAGRQLGLLRELLEAKRLVAVGEAGLDKLAGASMEFQSAVFKRQIELSEEYGLPLIIHCVKAADELLALKRELHPVQPWIWHGFRGKPEQAEQLLRKGFYLSFGGRYPERTMKAVPDGRLLLETDDGPESVEEILCRAATVRGVGREELRMIVCNTVRDIFFRA